MRSEILRISVTASESTSLSTATRSTAKNAFAIGLQSATKMPISDPACRSGEPPRNARRRFKSLSVLVRSSSCSIRCSTRWNIWRSAPKKSCRIYEDLFAAKDAKFTKDNLTATNLARAGRNQKNQFLNLPVAGKRAREETYYN